MVSVKILALVAVTSTVSAQGPQKLWGQCGGLGWTGPTICEPGITCVKLNDWFSQCLNVTTTTTSTLSRTTSTTLPYYTTTKSTTTKTTTKTTTTRRTTTKSTTSAKTTTTKTSSRTTSKVTTTTKVTTTSPPPATQTPWGQCGGQGYVGPTICPFPFICVYQNPFISQCLPDPSVSTTARTTSSRTTTSIKPVETFNYLFTFGDSYSQTGFDLAGTKPSIGNQLGNPPLPGWTTSGGLNWIGNLVSSNPQLLSYNLASGGATTDAALVVPFAPTVLSLVDQVNQFTSNLSPPPAYAPWTAADSLFAIWIGVNDVGNAWYRPEWPVLSGQIIDRYFEQVQKLYDAGARKFAFLTVPPINRAPANLGADEWSQTNLKAAIATYNELLVSGRDLFVAANPGVYAPVIDIFPKFDLILDNPTTYGAVNSSCWNLDGTTCLWWNDYHPGLVLQNGVADDVAVIVGLYL